LTDRSINLCHGASSGCNNDSVVRSWDREKQDAMAKTYRRAEVEELLQALERNAKAVVDAARAATTAAGRDKFEGYTGFRERCEDFDTLAILIEHRLMHIAGGKAEDLEGKFSELKIFMLTATLRTSLHFLRVLAARDALPLGSRDIFLRELRHLHAARSRMTGAEYAGRLDPGTAADMQRAEEILGLILDRAPTLLDLTRRDDAA